MTRNAIFDLKSGHLNVVDSLFSPMVPALEKFYLSLIHI